MLSIAIENTREKKLNVSNSIAELKARRRDFK